MPRRPRIVRRYLNGATSGFLATFPMTVVMLGIRKALPIFSSPCNSATQDYDSNIS